jgi:methylenetetrahydrofolate dehydrogenase (NADP+)/methenyltetrahydrofolate cyclohydrolase
VTARKLDGVAVAHAIRAEVRPEVEAFVKRTGRPPGLALVLVGNDPASELYVGSKLKSAGETGLRADIERLPASASLDELLHLIDSLNQSDARRHPGAIALPQAWPWRRTPGVRCCRAREGRGWFSSGQRGSTAQGRAISSRARRRASSELLERSNIPIAGRHAVDRAKRYRRKPMALLLLQRRPSPSATREPSTCRGWPASDILIAAIGGVRHR